MLTVAEFRERMLAEKDKTTSKVSKDASPFYPVWKMETGQTSTIRFAPDADDDNPFYWREKRTISLPFAGVEGNTAAGATVTVAVPCMSTWGEKDPIIEDTKHLWDQNRDLARLFYFKRGYMFRGFVVQSAFEEASHQRNDVRYFQLTPSIFKQVEAANMDPDLENFVCDPEHGRDFRIKKGTQGEYASYDMSSFAAKERALTDAEVQALAASTATLNTLVGEKPDADRQALIYSMYESSRRSEAFDPARFPGFYYRAANTKLAEDFE